MDGRSTKSEFQTRCGVSEAGPDSPSQRSWLPRVLAASAFLSKSSSRSHPKMWFQLGVVRDAHLRKGDKSNSAELALAAEVASRDDANWTYPLFPTFA